MAAANHVPGRTIGEATIPSIGLGTWRLNGRSGSEIVLAALEVGYRHIDTAQMYDNESCVGAGLAASGVARDDCWVTTKINDENHRPDDMRRSFEQSLTDLRIDRVDLLLVHWPVCWETMAETLAVLTEFAADGRATHVGVSNFEVDQVQFAVEHAPVEVNQIEYHPLLGQADLLAQAEKLGLHVTAYCPIARGLVLEDEACVSVASKHGVTPAQAALAWVTSRSNVSAIPQTGKRERLVENLEAAQVELDDGDIALIDATHKTTRLVSPPKSPWRRPGHRRT
ncbi:MAG: aldo/keto reductase [Actinomycetia bacterium]|nr:aldo/keto reductase [Actinomycetes bacterium]